MQWFRKNGLWRHAAWGLIAAGMLLMAGPAMAVDEAMMNRMEELVQKQQAQIEAQARAIEKLQKQVGTLTDTAVKEATEAAKAEVAKVSAPTPADKIVTSGQERVKLAISGQVNRMVNVIDDGKNTTAYYVDNDVSNTRMRLVGTADVTEDVTLGSRLEYAVTSNESGDVNQNNESAGDFFNVRWADLTVASKRFGKLWIGRGDTASNNTAEVDLSKVDILAYASVADPAGGMLFRQNQNDTLTDVSVADAFNDRDGLSRASRVRYDTPTFLGGFHLAGSVVENQQADGAVYWSGQGYGFKAAAAAAVANPNKDDSDLQYNGSFSVLHEGTGLNLTASAGLLDRDSEGDPTNMYVKLGWLPKFFDVGQTGFGVDYCRSLNLPTGRDDGYSVGTAIVQQLTDYGMEVYLGYRLYSLNRDVAPDVQSMDVGTLGMRVKF